MPDARVILGKWLDAIEAGNVDEIIDMLADDVAIETEEIPSPITGKEMLRRLLADAMGAYESIRIDRRKVVASGNDVALFARIHARFSKDLEMYGETLPTEGKSLDIAGAIFAEIDEAGKISRMMRVRDTLGIVQQLGISADVVADLTHRFEEQAKRRAA